MTQVRNVFEAILRYGHDEDFNPEPSGPNIFEATDAPAGSPEKIEILRRRIELGNAAVVIDRHDATTAGGQLDLVNEAGLALLLIELGAYHLDVERSAQQPREGKTKTIEAFFPHEKGRVLAEKDLRCPRAARRRQRVPENRGNQNETSKKYGQQALRGVENSRSGRSVASVGGCRGGA